MTVSQISAKQFLVLWFLVFSGINASFAQSPDGRLEYQINNSRTPVYDLSTLNPDTVLSVSISGESAHLNRELLNFEHLEELYLWLALEDVPEWFGQMQSLRRLVFEHPGFTQLPEVLGELTQLNELTISKHDCHGIWNCNLSVGDWISKMEGLTELTFWECDLDLPESLGKLPNLKLFKCMGGLDSFPEMLLEIPSIEYIILFATPTECPENLDTDRFECRGSEYNLEIRPK